jgi:hypothetical protein
MKIPSLPLFAGLLFLNGKHTRFIKAHSNMTRNKLSEQKQQIRLFLDSTGHIKGIIREEV